MGRGLIGAETDLPQLFARLGLSESPAQAVAGLLRLPQKGIRYRQHALVAALERIMQVIGHARKHLHGRRRFGRVLLESKGGIAAQYPDFNQGVSRGMRLGKGGFVHFLGLLQVVKVVPGLTIFQEGGALLVTKGAFPGDCPLPGESLSCRRSRLFRRLFRRLFSRPAVRQPGGIKLACGRDIFPRSVIDMGQTPSDTSLGGIVTGFPRSIQCLPIGNHRTMRRAFLLLGETQIFPGRDALRQGSPSVEIRRGRLQAPFIRIRQEAILALVCLRRPQRLHRRLPTHACTLTSRTRQQQAPASQ